MSLLPWRKPTAPATPASTQSLASFQQEMNNLFESFFGPSNFLRPPFEGVSVPAFPPVTVAESAAAVTVTAEMPGIAADDIHVHVDGHVLTLAGEKREERRHEDKDKLHRVERSFGSFTRRVELPAAVDPAHAEATLDHGVLTLKLPKLAADASRRIKVQAK